MGSVHGMATQLPATSDAAIMTTLASLAEALRCQHPTMVAYTTWVAEGWRVLHWQLKQTTLFWEMLLLYTKDSSSVEQDSSGGGEKLRRGPTQPVEVPISALLLFLFLHLHPDALVQKAPASAARLHADSVWPSEDAPSPRSAAAHSPRNGLHSPTRHGAARHGMPHSPGGRTGVFFGAGAAGGAGGGGAGGAGGARGGRCATGLRAHRLAFVRRHVAALLRLLADRDAPGGSSSTAAVNGGAAAAPLPPPPPHATRGDLSSLGFLIAGGHALDDPGPWDLADLCALRHVQAGTAAAPAAAAAAAAEAAAADADAAAGSWGEVCEWVAAALTVNDVLYPVPPSPAAQALADAHAAPPQPAAPSLSVADAVLGTHAAFDDDFLSPGAPGGGAAAQRKGSISKPLRLAEPDGGAALPLVINGAHKTTIVHAAAAGAAAARQLQINQCHESYMYVLAPLRHATIVGCTDCTIVVGAVRGALRVEDCARVTLVAAARRVCAVNCCECALHAYTPARPLFCGDTRACHVAPYNAAAYPRLRRHLAACDLLPPPRAAYPRLRRHLAVCDLLPPPRGAPPAAPPVSQAAPPPPPPRNMWCYPLDLNAPVAAPVRGGGGGSGGGANSAAAAAASPRVAMSPRAAALANEEFPHAAGSSGGSGGGAGGGNSSVSLMPPDAFHCITVPAPRSNEAEEGSNPNCANPGEGGAQGGAAAVNPFPLPAEYAAALREREAQLAQLEQLVQQSDLFPRQQRDLKRLVQQSDLFPRQQRGLEEALVQQSDLFPRQQRDLKRLVQQSDLFPRQQRELEEAVRGRFTEWLLSSGNLRQVLDLVQLERTGLSLGGNVSVSSGVGGAANVSAADIGTE
ncbi:tubulin binding cofactor C-domain-containing protein [Tribonema minus]|uniref:Tubulin binding cofactor C-domain-containing protein n=1 Tax=Tribonema minus TaxID=303371 RepID=A0A835YHX7_9STRA|nr:tubulin binding cofactor C-domain-containing protein [Tribonema minus]